MKVTKYILPVVVGAIIGMILIKLGENLTEALYPLPIGTDRNDLGELAKAIAAMPKAAFGLLLLGYITSSFVAGIAATLVSGREIIIPAMIVGIVLTLSGLFNVISFPKQPLWFSVVNLLVYLPSALLGYIVSRRKAAQHPE